MSRSVLLIATVASLGLAACAEGGNAVYRNLTGSTTCPGLSAVAQEHLFASPERLARCGPQTQSPY